METGEGSSGQPKPGGEKPVIVRVKRKSSHSPLDAFWLEINERPWKRQLLDLERLSISDTLGDIKREELSPRKVLVKRVETVFTLEDTVEIVQSFVTPNSTDGIEGLTKSDERRQAYKKHSQQEQLLSKARQSQEILAKSVRFKQIWRRRQENNDALMNTAVHDICRFYDIIRVDTEERLRVVQEREVLSLEDQKLLSGYLPLLREFIPSAAEELELDLHPHLSDKDDYVYDYYTVEDGMDVGGDNVSCSLPLVQVEDDDFFDDPDDESECESYDSNAEAHPRNDYPDESSEEEDNEDVEEDAEDDEEASGTGSEEKDGDCVSSEFSEHQVQHLLDVDEILYEYGLDDYDDFGSDFDYHDDSDEGEDWR